ncbi:MAG: magnesium chelatase, partial [Kiritimatiellae bacterium]|nr:magnesium chelatase [Kiritimatiellia bacterium]
TGEPSAAIRERVKVARQVQHHRFKGLRKVHCNAALRPKEIQKHCALKPDAQDLLKMAITELHFSARAYDRILKVSRTIADLDGSADIQAQHVSEAIQYRTLDRQFWI